VNDGVEIGEGSLVASGATLIERMIVPARSLVVGLPGRVRGQVKERHVELIRRASEDYVEKALQNCFY